jgi:hypothetical protein
MDLPWGACALKFAVILPHPYAAKGDWQAHPAWDAAKSAAEPAGVGAATAAMQATGQPPALVAAVAPGDSPTVGPRGRVPGELKIRVSEGQAA